MHMMPAVSICARHCCNACSNNLVRQCWLSSSSEFDTTLLPTCTCRSFSYEEFIAAQEKFQKRQSEQLAVLNEEVARAIEDVIALVQVRSLQHLVHMHHLQQHCSQHHQACRTSQL